MTKCT